MGQTKPAVHTIPQKLYQHHAYTTPNYAPAVHTIPQKLAPTISANLTRLSLLSTLSPKNERMMGSLRGSLMACCPHYPPKTSISLPPQVTKRACCPHYPPKTRCTRLASEHYRMPAVHTIPQKRRAISRRNPLYLSLLSTLSPKNLSDGDGHSLRSYACCPHYPPKTWRVVNDFNDEPKPAVHTIPQKRAYSGQLCSA